MLVERLTFQAKYGHGDELVGLFKERASEFMNVGGARASRIYTDATGQMFTVQVEMEFDDWNAYAAFMGRSSQMFGDAGFQQWFERMTGIVAQGSRELYNVEKMA